MAVYQQLIATDFNFGVATEDLSNTLFKTSYNIPDPCLLNLEINGINCNYHFGSVTDINIPYSGDMLYKLTLHAILPKIKARYNIKDVQDVFNMLETAGINLNRFAYYDNVNSIKFTNNKKSYDKILSLINEWDRNTVEINNKINNIFKQNFNANPINDLINNDPLYETYLKLKSYESDNRDSCATSIVSNEWIIKNISQTLINSIITDHGFKKDFELLLTINSSNTINETVNNLMNELTVGSGSNTILLKYLYEYQSNLTNAITYASFFEYIKTQINGQYSTTDHWNAGAILCRQNSGNKIFCGVGTLITTAAQQDILDNISVLLNKILELSPSNIKETLDTIAISSDYLNFGEEDVSITCCTLNLMPVATLVKLKEKLLEKCMESYYEIKIIVAGAIDRVIKITCKKLQSLLPFLLKHQHSLFLDNKLHIILKEKLITHEMLYKTLSIELKELLRYNGITSILEIAKEYLLSSEISGLISQVNAYIESYENSTVAKQDNSNLKTDILKEINAVEQLVMLGFNNICLDTWLTNIDSSTYDNAVNSVFANILQSNTLVGILDNETINNIRDNLLLESYSSIKEFLEYAKIDSQVHDVIQCESIVKEQPIHSVILANNIASCLLDKMKYGYLYKASINRNIALLENTIKHNKKALKNKLNIIGQLEDIYDGKRVKLSYVPQVGVRMIKKIDFYIGSQLLGSDYGQRMIIDHELNDKLKNRENYNKLTSENPVYVPIDLWFTKNYESALPLCNLSNQQITLRVTLKKITKLIELPDHCEIENRLSFPGSILGNYIYLPPADRNEIVNSVGYNVIELIQKMGPNYINYDEKNSDQNYFSFQYHPRRMVKTLFINTDVKDANTIKSIKISLDGAERESEKPFNYYNQIQPYERFTSSLENGKAVYTFSIDPSDPQPLGCLDMSNVPSLIITFKINKKNLRAIKQIKINVYSSYYELLRFCKKCE